MLVLNLPDSILVCGGTVTPATTNDEKRYAGMLLLELVVLSLSEPAPVLVIEAFVVGPVWVPDSVPVLLVDTFVSNGVLVRVSVSVPVPVPVVEPFTVDEGRRLGE